MFRLGVLTGVNGLCMKKKSTQTKGVKATMQTGFLFAGNVLANKLQGAVSSFCKTCTNTTEFKTKS